MHPDLVLAKLTQRIREEFEETPGLRLTVGEGARFWGLDEITCRQVLVRLRASGALTIDADHRYRQALVDPADGDRPGGEANCEGGIDDGRTGPASRLGAWQSFMSIEFRRA